MADRNQESPQQLGQNEEGIVTTILGMLKGGANDVESALLEIKQLRRQPLSQAAYLLLLYGITTELDRQRAEITGQLKRI